MKYVSITLPETYTEGLDELVRGGMYPNRSTVIRAAVKDLLKSELWDKKCQTKSPETLRKRYSPSEQNI